MQNTDRVHPTSFPRASSNPHPSLPAVLQHDSAQIYFDESVYPPPLSLTVYTAHENMNSSPKLMRSSMYTIPCESHMLNAIGMPFYIALHPFYPYEKKSVKNVIRCFECNSFINCYTKYEGDNKFICNICNAKNHVKDFNSVILPTIEYTYQKTSLVETKKDELFVNDSYFNWKVFTFPILVIGIQVNENTIKRIASLIHLLSNDNFETSFGKVLIFTFDENITVYKNLGSIEEYKFYDKLPFLSPDFFSDRIKAIEILEYLNNNLQITGRKPVPQILEFIVSASGYSFGKSLLFVDQTVNVPPLFVDKMNENSFSLNLVSTNSTELHDIVKMTCGCVYSDSLLPILRSTYYDVYLEIKTSDSISKSSIFTHIPIDNTLSIHFSSMDSSTVVGCSLLIDEATKEGQQIYVQAIINYSNFDSRKVLVLNHGFKTTYSLTSVFAGLSFDTIFHYFARLAAQNKENLPLVKSSIVKALRLYRHIVAKSVSESQMVLPENIKLLPLMYSCILKQSRMLPFCTTLSIPRVVRLFYPRIFSLTDFMLSSKFKLINATFSTLSYNDTYVVENGVSITIYMGREMAVTEEEFLEEEGETIQALRNIISNEYDETIDIRFVKMGKKDAEILGMMVEDKMNDVSSYGDFLHEMHYLIKN